MDIHFSCPACGHHMVIDETGAGMVVECPECGHDANVPKAVELKPVPSPKPALGSESEKERTVALKWTPPSAGHDSESKK